MIDRLPSWWNFVAERSRKEPQPALAPVDPSRLVAPFDQLPPVRKLTPLQQTWLEADLTKPHSMLAHMAYQQAAAIRGPSAESHEKRRRKLQEVSAEVSREGFQLPDDFTGLLANDELVTRMRFGRHSFQLPDFVCRCPLDRNLAMVLFLWEVQGCHYTHLLLSKDGRHCVTRSGHCYGIQPLPPSVRIADEEKQIFHYADSFAEFLCIASDEICRDELAGAERRMRLADEAREAGALEEAAHMYELALSYDPDSPVIADRIASCRQAS